MRQEISQVFTPRGSCHVPVLFSRCRPTGRNHTVHRHRSPPGELRRKSARRSREGLLASLSPSIKSRTTDLRYGLKLRVSRRTPKATTLFNWAPLDLTAGCLLIRPRRCQGQRSATIYEMSCNQFITSDCQIPERVLPRQFVVSLLSSHPVGCPGSVGLFCHIRKSGRKTPQRLRQLQREP